MRDLRWWVRALQLPNDGVAAFPRCHFPPSGSPELLEFAYDALETMPWAMVEWAALQGRAMLRSQAKFSTGGALVGWFRADGNPISSNYLERGGVVCIFAAGVSKKRYSRASRHVLYIFQNIPGVCDSTSHMPLEHHS